VGTNSGTRTTTLQIGTSYYYAYGGSDGAGGGFPNPGGTAASYSEYGSIAYSGGQGGQGGADGYTVDQRATSGSAGYHCVDLNLDIGGGGGGGLYSGGSVGYANTGGNGGGGAGGSMNGSSSTNVPQNGGNYCGGGGGGGGFSQNGAHGADGVCIIYIP